MRAGAGVLVAAAAAGAALLITLLPRLDIVASEWRPSLGRDDAVARAVALAHERGVNLSGWRFAVTTTIENQLLDLWPRYRDNPMMARHAPLRLRVIADSGAGEAVQITLSPDGRLLAYVSHLRRHGPAAPAPELVRREFIRYVGGWSESYRLTAHDVRTREGLRSAWERTDARLAGVLERVEVTTDGSAIVRSSCLLELAPGTSRRGEARWEIPQLTSVLVLIFVLTLTVVAPALWSFFSSLARRNDHVRFGLRFLWLPAAGLLISEGAGEFWNHALAGSFEQNSSAQLLMLQALVAAAFALITIFLLVSSGYAVLPRSERWHWVSAALMARGRVWNRPVGRSITLGLAGGIALAAEPYALAWLTGLTRVRLFESREFLVAAHPELDVTSALAFSWDVTVLIGFLLPWMARHIRRRHLRWLLLVALGGLGAAAFRDALADSFPLNLLNGVLWAAGLLFIYRVAGLLGAWMAPLSVYAAIEGGRLLALGHEPFSHAGWLSIGLCGALAALGAVAWKLGEEENGATMLAEMEDNANALPRPERERLLADFGVARRAQQGLLPEAPPAITGLDISAVCEPAREVGGDLYDYLHFPEGDWGLCVADVSGKGVPAALYMTLTKGMLASAQLHPADPRGLALQLNRALAEAGKHKVFVTLSLLLVDRDGRHVRHIRAGHNPPLLRRAATGECVFLKPAGIGLGLTTGGAFERNLEVESFELEPGDVIVIYSDGLVECENERGEQFTEERLVAVVNAAAGAPAEDLKQQLLAAARAFRGTADPHDDLTVLVARAVAPNPIP